MENQKCNYLTFRVLPASELKNNNTSHLYYSAFYMILSFLVIQLSLHHVLAQETNTSSNIVFGTGWDGDVYHLIRLEVLDPDDGMPVRGAEVLVGDYSEIHLGIASTDQEGFAFVLFRGKFDLSLYTPFSIRVRKPQREQWYQKFDDDDILDNMQTVGIWIPRNMSGPITDQVITNAISTGRYSPWWNPQYFTHGSKPPGINEDEYEYRITPAYRICNLTVPMRKLPDQR